MGATASLTIKDLVERTGVPATTIHHYQRLGLLPDADRLSSNRFRYDDRHVQAVRLIRLLRERRRLPLATVRRVLPELLSHDDQAFRPGMWEHVIASDAHDAAARARDAVVSAARGAFTAHGYAKVSVADVCDAVGIAKGTFYRIFSSKDELFTVAATALVHDVVRQLADTAPGRALSEAEVATFLDGVLAPEVSLLVDATMRALHGNSADARVAEELVATLRSAIAKRLRARRTTPEAVASGLLDAAIGRALRGAVLEATAR